MRNILTAVLLLSSNIFGSEWVITVSVKPSTS